MSRLKKNQTQTNPLGTFRDGYADPEPFEVWIVRQDDPRIRLRWTYPTKRIYENGTVQPIGWTWERLHDAFQPYLCRHQAQYVKWKWMLDIRTPAPEPSTDEVVRMRTDRLAAKLAAALPKVEMPHKPPIPTRAILEQVGREEPGATEPEEMKPPQGRLNLTGQIPEADEAFFEKETKELTF